MRLPSATIRTLLCVGADIVRPPLPGTRQKTVDAAKIRRTHKETASTAKIRRAHNVRPYKSPRKTGRFLTTSPFQHTIKTMIKNPGREGRIP